MFVPPVSFPSAPLSQRLYAFLGCHALWIFWAFQDATEDCGEVFQAQVTATFVVGAALSVLPWIIFSWLDTGTWWMALAASLAAYTLCGFWYHRLCKDWEHSD